MKQNPIPQLSSQVLKIVKKLGLSHESQVFML